MSLGKLAAMTLILVIAGCSSGGWNGVIDPVKRPSQKTAFPEISDWKSVRIELERTICGVVACGVPKVAIAGDGTVTFNDKFTTHIPPYKVRALVRKFQRVEFFWTYLSYPSAIEDPSVVELSMAFDDQKSSIHMEGSEPAEISALVDEVDKTAGTAAWMAGHRH